MIRREFLTGAAASVMASRALADGLSGVFDPTPGGVGPLSPLGGAGLPSWLIRGPTGGVPKFQSDPANSQFWINGKAYTNETAFNAASKGVISGSARIYGPFDDPTGTNLISNGSFPVDTTGWAAFNSGSIAASGGECVLTAAGSLSSFSQGVPLLGRAAKFSFSGRRGTSGNSFIGLSSVTNNLGTSGGALTTGISSGTETPQSVYTSGLGAATAFFGVRNTSGAGTGTGIFTGFSLVEAWPFLGWTPNSLLILVETVAPVSASFDQVIWQSDDNATGTGEKNRIRLVRLVADNTVHLIITTNNVLMWDSGSLGVVAGGGAISVAMELSQTSTTVFSWAVAMNGAPPVLLSAGNKVLPGVSVMRDGTSFTGGNDNWGGSIPLVAVY